MSVSMKPLSSLRFVMGMALLLPCLSCACLVAAQMKSDRERDGLFGSVRAMRIEKTTLSETGWKDPEGSWVASEVTYDNKGNKTEETTYKADGSLMKRSVFDYDTAGNQVAVTVYNGDGSIYLKRVRKSLPVSEGRKIEETIWASGTTLQAKAIYTFDDKDRGTELADFDANGKPDMRQVTIYGTNGQPTQVEIFHQNSLIGKIAFTYDSHGNLREIAEHDAGGVQMGKHIFSGDLKRS